MAGLLIGIAELAVGFPVYLWVTRNPSDVGRVSYLARQR